MSLFTQFFTWWNGSTWGTRFFTWRKGTRVGEDGFGNVYYKSADDKRWVQYNGLADPSTIPAGWHGWIHHRVDVAPPDETYNKREWELAHRANPTGSSGAYYPKGSLANPQERPKVTGDYDAWRP